MILINVIAIILHDCIILYNLLFIILAYMVYYNYKINTIVIVYSTNYTQYTIHYIIYYDSKIHNNVCNVYNIILFLRYDGQVSMEGRRHQ